MDPKVSEKSDFDRLLDIRYYFFHKGEGKWWISLIGVVLLQVVAVLLILVNDARIINVTSFLSVLISVGIIWLRQQAGLLIHQGDKCDRLLLYSDGLKQPIPPYEMATAEGWVLGRKITDARYVQPFYFSKLPAGSKRLLDNTGESSFFTTHLTRKIASYLSFVLGISLGCVLIVLYTMLTVTSDNTHVAPIGKAVVSIIVFLLCGDLALLRYQYVVSSRITGEIFKTCSELLSNRNYVSSEEALQIVGEYYLALAQSPPSFELIYMKYGPSLNGIYRHRMKREEEYAQ